MEERKTMYAAADPAFIGELAEVLEVLSSPLRLKILKFIEGEPREIAVIADYVGMSYPNTKKHLDRLVSSGLVQRAAGFSRETERGIAPVWKYSLAPQAMAGITATLGIFSNIAPPMGYGDVRDRIASIRRELAAGGGPEGPVLYLIGGPADGKIYPLQHDRIALGREDPEQAPDGQECGVILPDGYRAVTRITKPHAFIIQTADAWQLQDNASTGGTFLNGRRLDPLKMTPLSGGDIIDLATGTNSARLLFLPDE